MKSKLICYSTKSLKTSAQKKFQRDLYGFKDISCNCKYVYKRSGLLNSMLHKKIIDCVILVSTDDAKSLVRLLKKHDVETHVFSVSAKLKN